MNLAVTSSHAAAKSLTAAKTSLFFLLSLTWVRLQIQKILPWWGDKNTL